MTPGSVEPHSENRLYVLVTGANSGLGFATCCRLVDEFLETRPLSQSLTLIFTTRDSKKSQDTISRLRLHLHKRAQRLKALSDTRITFQPEQLDLTSLRSVQELSKKLLSALPSLDATILNAGYGGFTGLNWPVAIWTILTGFPHSVTWPTYKLSGVGYVTKPQHGSTASDSNEPPLAKVFCSNVFGHYLLCHNLVPLLSRPRHTSPNRGRIIWISSLEAYASSFSLTDLQGLHSPAAYESSKRLTDILALTASLPSTKPWTDSFLSTPPSAENAKKPKIYVTHPGICATAIIALPLLLQWAMTLAFYFARLVGSPWHTVSAYKGACAPVWVALASQSQLDSMEEEGGAGKWGSGVDQMGEERVMRTEVEGWGYGGRVGDVGGRGRKGRRRDVRDLTGREREAFEDDGRAAWREMEGLRMEWEGRLRWAG
ncbi:3-keto-steroid reductase [Hypocenomyce scalaris]|nr:3-keto-steroid reductase [Hypocenomyce scalaris]